MSKDSIDQIRKDLDNPDILKKYVADPDTDFSNREPISWGDLAKALQSWLDSINDINPLEIIDGGYADYTSMTRDEEGNASIMLFISAENNRMRKPVIEKIEDEGE